MKTMKKFLSMAALAMVGAMTVGCTSEDNVIDQAQTATKNNVVTQTVTVGFDEQAATRALAIDYDAKTLTKTFAEGDQIAVIYENESNELVKATVTIAAGDISTDKKSAKFTVTMTNPKASGTLKYIYPAAMAGATDVDYNKLNSQDGTLASLASNLDLAVYDGTLTAEKALPASATLENKLAILALTIKDNATTPNDITSTIKGMNIIAGTNSYTITGKDADVHIYAAIQATSGANISYFATDGTKNYTKAVTGKTYVANNIYNLGLKMDDATTVSPADFTTDQTIGNGSTLSGYQSYNVKISIADGAIVTLKDVTINGKNWTDGDYAGITCEGSATIILEGDNMVKGFNASYPGIYVPEGKTLTIMGSGKLTASSNGSGSGAGIGGGDGISCGNIVIKGGEITATGGANGGAGIGGGTGSCGNITISGGTITATGGTYGGAGIGGGLEGTCSTITISGGNVTATGGYGGAGIGGGTEGICGNITISGGNVDATGGGSAAGIGGGVENYPCGTITITSGVTKVEATKGSGAPNSIGKGNDGEDITVTIDGVANATTSSEFPNFTSEVSGNTWTLTHK